jgi:hypothetical protein
MKVALIYNRQGSQLLMHQDGAVRAFPVFRWWWGERTPQSWQLHLLAFCVASTEDFKFQSFQGVLAIGRNRRRNWRNYLGFWLEFAPGQRVLHIGGKNAA